MKSSKQRQANDLYFAGANLKIFTFFNGNISDENILPVTFGKYNPKTDNKDAQYKSRSLTLGEDLNMLLSLLT